ncbi:MAG: hypothetical protein JW801_04875 [Bacteroidales bacterium]|nr:hypothetical protein [Bacteroidales bacterium]
MSNYVITVSGHKQYVLTKVYGDVTRGLARQFIIESHELAVKNGIDKLIFDLREAVNVESPVGNFDLVNHDITEMPASYRLIKVATLVAPDDHSHDFIETLVINRGHNNRQCRSMQEALDFLEVEE